MYTKVLLALLISLTPATALGEEQKLSAIDITGATFTGTPAVSNEQLASMIQAQQAQIAKLTEALAVATAAKVEENKAEAAARQAKADEQAQALFVAGAKIATSDPVEIQKWRGYLNGCYGNPLGYCVKNVSKYLNAKRDEVACVFRDGINLRPSPENLSSFRVIYADSADGPVNMVPIVCTKGDIFLHRVKEGERFEVRVMQWNNGLSRTKKGNKIINGYYSTRCVNQFIAGEESNYGRYNTSLGDNLVTHHGNC